MQAFLNVKPSNKTSQDKLDGVTRTYYIAAEETMWNYAPSGVNKFSGGKNLSQDSHAKTFFEEGPSFIGGTYKKALFIEYTDGTFSTKVVRKGSDVHLGFLGPVVRGEVGDTVKVVFRNNANRNYSIQAQGLAYGKDQEGSVYNGGKDDLVATGCRC